MNEKLTVEMLEALMLEVRGLRAEVMNLRREVSEQKLKGAWMDLREAGEYLHLSVSSMKNRMADGEFPWAVKRGRKWMFPAEKVRMYAANI